MGRCGEHDEMVEQRLLDLLVDGELNDEQERALIARLEETPDGWRRCALTFLESRCWQRGAREVTRPCWELPDAPGAGRAAEGWRTRPWTWAVTIAATFLLAFAVGSFLPSSGDRAGPGPPPSPAAPALPAGAGLAQVGHASAGAPPGPADDLYRGSLRLVNDAGSEIDLPVYDWNQQAVEELLYRYQPLPPHLVRQLKRHNLRSSRSLVPMQLEDGTRILVPVQEVDITRVSDTSY